MAQEEAPEESKLSDFAVSTAAQPGEATPSSQSLSALPLTHETFIQPVSSAEAPVTADEGTTLLADAKTKQLLKDRAAKVYKQHVEIVNLRHELEKAVEEKKSLEDEIRSRSEEVYKMNEKMIFLEYERRAESGKQVSQQATGKVLELRS